MTKGRLEAFSDGVIAIIITIMVLELRPPEGYTLQSLLSVAPGFLAYLLSIILSVAIFVIVGLVWLVPDRRIEKQLVP